MKKLFKQKNNCEMCFRNMNLSGKMISVYLAAAIMMYLISMAGLQMSFSIYDQKLYEKSLQELEFFIQRVGEDLRAIEDLSYTLAMDEEIQDILREAGREKYLSQSYYYMLSRIRRIVLNEVNIHPSVKNVIYTDGENVNMTIGTDCGTVSEAVYTKLHEVCSQMRGGYAALAPTEEFPYLLSGRDILETKNARLTYLGTFMITSDIAGMIEKKKSELKYAGSMLFVYSDDGIVCGKRENMPQLPQIDEGQGCRTIRYENERYLMCYLKSDKTGWMYVNYVPYNDILGQTAMLRYGMFAGIFAVFLVIYGMVHKVAGIITSPLRHLTQTIYLVEKGDFHGALDFLKVEERMDEAGLLTQEFQIMLEKIICLIHENYEKQLLLKDTKYKMLQAQINPHFMSNTLNVLNWTIRAGKNEDARRMVVELGSLMHFSLSRELYASASEELEAAKSYITIQQYRYKSRVRIQVVEEGDLSGYQVPRMILQPLIENSIHYGVEQSLNACAIRVLAREEDGLVFCVEDEGPGMDEEELAAVRNGTIVPKGHGIGLKNIRERLRNACAESEFIIESSLGSGTRVTIRMPQKSKEKDDVQTFDRG